ncbi:glycoside hydrolase family 3 protein [Paenibacillus sp. YN15]|uniref:glycoside hydrolase family 3 protein n=1 Tax=Paenibacillus sp. YN15 TaxID=1742774 RepID=UPI0015EBECA8|nr:glycoside hydrolase family 3 protein [Paenibacillus sp. YN15]
MLKPITQQQREKIARYISEMTWQDKLSQVQCIMGSFRTTEEIKEAAAKWKVGSVFIGNQTKERFREIADAAKDADVPVIICADLVHGAGSRMFGATEFPHYLACAATDVEDSMKQMGEITAQEGRAYGVHWTFGPVVDLCLEKNNPMMHVRTAGDDTQRVRRMSKAFVEAVQKEGLMAATAKHFPGDGADERDTHITTLINGLSREEWEQSYGLIWREMIDSGVMAIMGGHIALPFIDPQYEEEALRYKGPRPATLSKAIQLDFLRGELGFDGLIVSDALNMVGFGAHIRREEYGWRLLEAGSDMLLWTDPVQDTPLMLEAMANGKLTEERVNDAVRRVLELKARVGLLDGEEAFPGLPEETLAKNKDIAQRVADRSITIVRDVFSSLPMKGLKPGAKVLTVTAQYEEGYRNKRDEKDLVFIDEELRKRGFQVDHLLNPGEGKLSDQMKEQYDAIFINIKYTPRYGSVRLYGESFHMFKGSWWVENPKVVFTSFGDPYKLYDLPSLHNYINVYSNCEVSQRAAVKVWLGEIEAAGKSPVNLDN